jgi:hypothetical protein
MTKKQLIQEIQRRGGTNTEPKPCKEFAKRFRWNALFLAHLPDCEACRATLRYFVTESEKRQAAKQKFDDNLPSLMTTN